MVSMINKAILRKDLGKLPSVKGMVRKSDVMAVVGKQKELSLEPNVLLDSIKELKEEYHSTGEFIMTMWRIFPLLKWRDESMHFLLFLQKYQITAKMLPYKRRRHKR